MDEIDFIIIKKLLENSRLTYRELAEMIEMSVSAMHKRLKKLVDDEIIEAFVVRPSAIALRYIAVLIFGTSKAKSMEVVSKELGQHDNIDFIGVTGGKFIYISIYLRNISELQDISVYVSGAAQMSDPIIGIVNMPYLAQPEPLTAIDYKILKSLNRDARKPITDIADDVGLSAKTVRKRLDRMIENELVEFTIEWSRKSKNNLSAAVDIYLNEGTNIDSIIQSINEKYSQNVFYCFSYSNIPNMLTMVIWTRTIQDFQKIQEELQTEGFKDIIPHIFLFSQNYDCWVDQLLRTK